MNIVKQVIIASILSAIAASPCSAAGKTESANISVSFHEPSHYADIDYDGMDTDKGHKIVLDQIHSVFIETANHWLPPSYRLEVTVRDIDMAGKYEPERGTGSPRIVKDIYMPRIKFDYRVLDTDGKVIREGAERLHNDSFLSSPARAVRSDQEVAYDVCQLIRDWGRKMQRDKLS